MRETTICGAIKFTADKGSDDGGQYVIRNAIGQGWQIPTRNIAPEDLRAMAAHLEQQRANKTAYALQRAARVMARVAHRLDGEDRIHIDLALSQAVEAIKRATPEYYGMHYGEQKPGAGGEA